MSHKKLSLICLWVGAGLSWTAHAAPIGYIDGVVQDAAGVVRVSGWACDSGIEAPLKVDLYFGSSQATGVFLKTVPANQPGEANLSKACGIQSLNHRFVAKLTYEELLKATGSKIYIMANSSSGSARNLLNRSWLFSYPAILQTPSLSWNAESDSIYDPVVFQWRFYLDQYPDLRGAGVNTEAQAKRHWSTAGIRECRRGSPEFSALDYLSLYPDLQRAYLSTDCQAALTHYLKFGRNENRQKVKPWSYAWNFGSGNATAGNERITLRTNGRYAGAATELWFRGHQYINSLDPGRLLQTALTWDGQGECYNPTEAGSSEDSLTGSTHSILTSLSEFPGQIRSQVIPAYWHAAGLPCNRAQPTVRALGEGPTSFISSIGKSIRVGFEGDPQIVEWQSVVTLQQPHSSMMVEGLTGYLRGYFSSFYVFNPVTRDLDSTTVFGLDTKQGNAAHVYPPVFATADGKYAMGVFSLDQELGQSPTQLTQKPLYLLSSYLQTSDPDNQTTKWAAHYGYPTAPLGDYRYTTYLVLGNLEEVRQRMAKLMVRFPTQGISLLGGRFGQIAYDGTYYASTYSDIARTYPGPDQTPLRVLHFFGNGAKNGQSGGMYEGRSGSSLLNPRNYLERYPDLMKNLGQENVYGAWKHFLLTGQFEKRNGKANIPLTAAQIAQKGRCLKLSEAYDPARNVCYSCSSLGMNFDETNVRCKQIVNTVDSCADEGKILWYGQCQACATDRIFSAEKKACVSSLNTAGR